MSKLSSPVEVHYAQLQQVNALTSSLSIMGCLFIIASFLAFGKLRKFFSRLVVYLAISDLWFCVGNLLGHATWEEVEGSLQTGQSRCLVQSSLLTFFGLSSILWTTSIAFALQEVILKKNIRLELDEPSMHCVCWGVPFLALSFSLLGGLAGPAGFWCWIIDTPLGSFMRMMVFYLPLWSATAYSFWIYTRINAFLKRVLQQKIGVIGAEASENDCMSPPPESESRLYEQASSLHRLMAFPAALCGCWFFGSVNRILGIVDEGWYSPTLEYLVVATGTLQGFVNACLYGSTAAVKEEIFDSLAQAALRMKERVKVWRNRSRGSRRTSRSRLPRGIQARVVGRQWLGGDEGTDLLKAKNLSSSNSTI